MSEQGRDEPMEKLVEFANGGTVSGENSILASGHTHGGYRLSQEQVEAYGLVSLSELAFQAGSLPTIPLRPSMETIPPPSPEKMQSQSQALADAYAVSDWRAERTQPIFDAEGKLQNEQEVTVDLQALREAVIAEKRHAKTQVEDVRRAVQSLVSALGLLPTAVTDIEISGGIVSVLNASSSMLVPIGGVAASPPPRSRKKATGGDG